MDVQKNFVAHSLTFDFSFMMSAYKVTYLLLVLVSDTSRIRWFDMAILCVYFPRYSMALPNPLNVFLI